jgi:hypothetical protein
MGRGTVLRVRQAAVHAPSIEGSTTLTRGVLIGVEATWNPFARGEDEGGEGGGGGFCCG